MLPWTLVKVALRAIRGHKMRAILTALGIVIGVASVVAMLGLAAGTEEKLTARMRAFGANLLSVRSEQRGGSSGVRVESQNLTVEDAQTILREVPEVVMASPDLDGRVQARYFNKNTRVEINGEAPTYFEIRNFTIAKGRIFTQDEVDRSAKVAVIGPKTATDLFGEGVDPIHQTIKVNNSNFLIIGMTAMKDEWSDDNLWAPYTTVMNQVLGQDEIDQIYVKVADDANMAAVQAKVEAVMRKAHKIQANAEDDFSVRNYQEAVDSANLVSDVFTYLLAGVAGISLLVGGVNIMNIMLVSVTERTREIGIRKALGAKQRDMLGQFLLESIVLSTTGGIIGIVLGVGTILGFNAITQYVSGEAYGAKIQMLPIVVSFSVSVLVGLLSGYYPAQRAAKMNAIDALRYE